MRTTTPPARLLLALASLALLVAACGGAASPSPSPGSTGGASPAATEPAEPTDAATPPAEPTGEDVDLSGAAAAIENLTTYQMDVTVSAALAGASGGEGTVTMQVLVDADNDAVQFSMTGIEGVPAGGMNVVIIGDDAWVNLGTGGYLKQEGAAAGFAGTLDAFAPDALLQSASADDLRGLAVVGSETKNGVETTHYRVDAASNPELAAELGGDGVFDVWIARDGGFLVSMSFSGEVDTDGTKSPVDMTIDISRFNDPTIDIQPPN